MPTTEPHSGPIPGSPTWPPGKSLRLGFREEWLFSFQQVLGLPFAHLPWRSLMQELPWPGTQQWPSSTELVCSLLFEKQVKSLMFLPEAWNCFSLDPVALIPVKTCLWREHLPVEAALDHHHQLVLLLQDCHPLFGSLLYLRPPAGPTSQAEADSLAQGTGVG